jgi:hypothetical protein
MLDHSVKPGDSAVANGCYTSVNDDSARGMTSKTVSAMPKTRVTLPELKEMHPLTPVIIKWDVRIAESAAVVDYVICGCIEGALGARELFVGASLSGADYR